MEKYKNLKLKQLELDIKQLLSRAEISVGTALFLLKNMVIEIENLYEQAIEQEAIEYKKEHSEEFEEKENETEMPIEVIEEDGQE